MSEPTTDLDLDALEARVRANLDAAESFVRDYRRIRRELRENRGLTAANVAARAEAAEAIRQRDAARHFTNRPKKRKPSEAPI